MQQAIDTIRKEFDQRLNQANSSSEIEELKVRFLGRKGPVQDLMKELRTVSPEERPRAGKKINDLKEEIAERLEHKLNSLSEGELKQQLEKEVIDISLPGRRNFTGRKHVITQALEEFINIFSEMGFTVQSGPVIESDWYNFGALNTPEHHPARSMQDTIYLDSEHLLRTHTSPIQIRVMEGTKPPIRIIAPGKAFRNEEITARSHVFFHQIEGLYIDKNVTFADLFGTMSEFLQRLFGKDVKVRYRPSYFPFVEPGLEVDAHCLACRGKGCSICKHTGWLEICGAGMVHPEVLKNGGIDPEEYSGFAWGMGVERLVMLRNGIPDIRMFVQNDMRMLQQFSAV